MKKDLLTIKTEGLIEDDELQELLKSASSYIMTLSLCPESFEIYPLENAKYKMWIKEESLDIK